MLIKLFHLIFSMIFLINLNAEIKNRSKNYRQGYERNEIDLMQGYNAPARIDLLKKIDFFISSSFVYLKANQNGLDLGRMVSVFPEDFIEKVINMDVKYNPGFKIAFGVNSDFDNWSFILKYFYFNISNKTFFENSPFYNIEIYRDIDNRRNLSNSVTAKWGLNLNIFDLCLTRAQYNGTHLITSPSIGIRTGKIDQDFNANYELIGGGKATSYQNSSSYVIGPKFAFLSKWIVFKGFNIFLDMDINLLYQQFNSSSILDDTASPGTILSNITDNSQGYINPNIYSSMGFGYGNYFKKNRFHYLINLMFNFEIFLDQNMMRFLRDNAMFGINASKGNLFLYGPILEFQIDF